MLNLLIYLTRSLLRKKHGLLNMNRHHLRNTHNLPHLNINRLLRKNTTNLQLRSSKTKAKCPTHLSNWCSRLPYMGMNQNTIREKR